MWAAGVVEAQLSTDSGAGPRDAGIGVQVDLFVFDGPPQTIDEGVLAPSTFAINADLDVLCGEHLDEVVGELPRVTLAALNSERAVDRVPAYQTPAGQTDVAQATQTEPYVSPTDSAAQSLRPKSLPELSITVHIGPCATLARPPPTLHYPPAASNPCWRP
jgi:hypothetical protein